MTFIVNFKDEHGIEHVDAVMEITHAYYTENKSISTDAEGQSENTSYHLSFNAHYYINQAAKDEGARSLHFNCASGCSKTYTEAPDTSDLKALAQAVLETEILPTMV